MDQETHKGAAADLRGIIADAVSIIFSAQSAIQDIRALPNQAVSISLDAHQISMAAVRLERAARTTGLNG